MPPKPPQTPPAHPPDSPDIFKLSCHREYGAGDCSEFAFCNAATRNGECIHGVCSCADGFIGADCGVRAKCAFWDEDLRSYSTRGCVTSPPPAGEPDGFLHCLCNHLTDFSVIRFPATLQDLLAELGSITFNTFTAEDALRFFTSFDPSKNPAITTYAVSVVTLWLVSLVFSRFRLHRRLLSGSRTARARRQQKRKALLLQIQKNKYPNGLRVEEVWSSAGIVQTRLSLLWATSRDMPPQGEEEPQMRKEVKTSTMPSYDHITSALEMVRWDKRQHNSSHQGAGRAKTSVAEHRDAIAILRTIRKPATLQQQARSSPLNGSKLARHDSRVLVRRTSQDDAWAPASRPAMRLSSAAHNCRKLLEDWGGLSTPNIGSDSANHCHPRERSIVQEDEGTPLEGHTLRFVRALADNSSVATRNDGAMSVVSSQNDCVHARVPRQGPQAVGAQSCGSGFCLGCGASPNLSAPQQPTGALGVRCFEPIASRPPASGINMRHDLQGPRPSWMSNSESHRSRTLTNENLVLHSPGNFAISPRKVALSFSPRRVTPRRAVLGVEAPESIVSTSRRAHKTSGIGSIHSRFDRVGHSEVDRLNVVKALKTTAHLTTMSDLAAALSASVSPIQVHPKSLVPTPNAESLGKPKPATSAWRRVPDIPQIRDAQPSHTEGECNTSFSHRASPRVPSATTKTKHVTLNAAASAQTKAKEVVHEISQIIYLVRTCQMRRLAVRISNSFHGWLKRFVRTARSEHTVVSFVSPMDVDGALSDMQCVQIFWNVVVLESVLLAMLFSDLPAQVSPTLVTLIIQAAITVFPCVAAAILLRLAFRMGNRGLRRRDKRERERIRSTRSGEISSEGFSRWKATKGKRKFTSKERAGLMRFVLVWFLVVATFAICLVMVMIYAMTFGEKKTRTFLLSMVLSLSSDFFVVEPIEILLLVSLPFLLDNAFVANVRARAKDLGLL